ncbi:unnamed protein product [Didymodactylos carnosus]|uniref:Uncharacterized protein n=1 Tax=Didymodactylos carnosus TaxID=1234261 RepID=A0A8S2S475_9BILA|nr:unnamed protein product [Didymodactylos carnosus]CAF4197116.1 unnamed protein product [Didymodactylos carnosus]
MPRREQTGKKKGASDTGVVEKKSEPLYCICKRREDEVKDDFMIECEACENWFHGRCMSLPDRIADDLEKYYCSACSPQHGPSVFKQRCNFHRRDYSDPLAEGKPVQTGTQTFINSLKRRVFLNSDSIIIRLKGSQLNVNYFYENGFTKPIFIANKEGLDISVPAKSITLKEISELVGPNKFVDVIDTERQATYSMLLNDFIDYFESFERTKTYNVLSLEVSNTKLGESIVTPQVVRDLSWATIGIWPKKRGEDEKEDSDNANVKKTEWSQQSGRKRNESSESSSGENDISYDEENFEHYERPEVAKYCLISPKDSYTDFHVDFGGSSVWYHILKGEKIFYLVEPTDENLQKYIEWNRSGNESETFFGDLVSTCYKMQLREENTILIPAGWIHAVYTPCDSLVFGGNFLNSLSVDIQLRVYELERMAQVPHKFQFPLFETFHWYAAKHYYDEIRGILIIQFQDEINNFIFQFFKHTMKLMNPFLM